MYTGNFSLLVYVSTCILVSFLAHALEEMMFHRIDGKLDTVVEMELFEHSADVIAHCFFAQVQQTTDLGVRFATRQVR